MAKKQTAKARKWNDYIKRWQQLYDQRTKLDYDTAGLAVEIREEFPDGTSGDLQFRIWCVRNLEIASATGAMLLRATKVYTLFDYATWQKLGGWPSIQFIGTLNATGRRKVIKACLKRADERSSGRIAYTSVLSVAYGLGVQSNHRTGRPNRLQVEEDLGFVRNWMKSLYDTYRLPAPPKAVEDAMKGTKLSFIAESAKKATGTGGKAKAW